MTTTGLAALLLVALLPKAPAQTLRAAGDKHQLLMGTAAGYGSLNDTNYTTTLAREYSQLQPENDLKWGSVHPQQSTFNFTNGDGLQAFAAAHSMKMRGHTLVWYQGNPSWLTSGGFTPAQLSTILQTHISTVAGHYQGKIYAWDVVNEAIADAGGGVRSSIWYDSPGIGFAGQGTKYIEQAFRWARAADANALLFYNDYGIEVVNPKSTAVYNMVKDFKNRGVPIDGVGFQAHLPLSSLDLASFDTNLQRFTALGIQVQITEMDVKVPVDANGNATAADLTTEANVYRSVLNVCLKYPQFTAFQTWGFTDAHSWIPGSYPGYGAALPFDKNYQPKPCYWQIRDLLQNQAEVLPIAASSGQAARTVTDVSYSGGEGIVFDSVAVGNYLTFTVNLPEVRPYDVRLGVKKFVGRGICQLAVAAAGTTNYTNHGSPIDLFSAAASFEEIDVNTFTPGTAGDKLFRFTVTGKNAQSSDYSLAIDYIRLIPQ